MATPPETRRTLTVREAADALGVSLPVVYTAAKSGALPSVRVGTRVLIPRAA